MICALTKGVLPFPNNKFYTLPKLKDFSDNNFEFVENGRKFSKRVENTLGKEEIAHYEQFLLFSQCFQKTCTADTEKPGFVWKRVKYISTNAFYQASRHLTHYQTTNFRLFQTERVCRLQI